MIQFSDLTGKTYDDALCVFFRNYVQAAHYISWGAKLVDLFVDSKTKLVFVFDKETHNKLIAKWNERKKQIFGDDNG